MKTKDINTKIPKENSTRDIIIKRAKENFLKYGYKKTRIQTIADETGISLGSLSFYFKKKENIASYLLYDYLNSFYTIIQESTDISNMNYVIMHAAASLHYYQNIYDDAQTRAFYLELLQNGSPHLNAMPNNPFMTEVLLIRNDYIKESSLINTKELTEVRHAFSMAGRHDLICKLMNGEYDHLALEMVVNTISASELRVMGIDNDSIQNAIKFATEYFRNHDLSYIQLLK